MEPTNYKRLLEFSNRLHLLALHFSIQVHFTFIIPTLSFLAATQSFQDCFLPNGTTDCKKVTLHHGSRYFKNRVPKSKLSMAHLINDTFFERKYTKMQIQPKSTRVYSRGFTSRSERLAQTVLRALVSPVRSVSPGQPCSQSIFIIQGAGARIMKKS